MESGTRRTAPDDAAIRYLLGTLGEAEQAAFEASLFSGGNAFEQTEASEDELVDDYLSGSLTLPERARFEEAYLLSPERRQRVELGRALRARLGEQESAEAVGTVGPVGAEGRFDGLADRAPVRPIPALAPGSAVRWMPIAAALFFAALGAWFGWDAARARAELASERSRSAAVQNRQRDLERRVAETNRRGSQAERDVEGLRQQVQVLGDQLATADVGRAGSGVVSFSLNPVRMRGAGSSPSLALPKAASAAVLVCPIDNPRPAPYRVSLETPEGRIVWTGTAAAPPDDAKSVTVVVPARVLTPGDFILSLTPEGSSERGGDFAFRVRRG